MIRDDFERLVQKIYDLIGEEAFSNGYGIMLIVGNKEDCCVGCHGDYGVIRDGLFHQLAKDEDFMHAADAAINEASKIVHPAPEWFEGEQDDEEEYVDFI